MGPDLLQRVSTLRDESHDVLVRRCGKLIVVYIKGATHFVFYDIDPGCERMALDETVSSLSRLG